MMAAPRTDWRPRPWVLRITAYAACLVVLGYALKMVLGLVGQLGIVFFPVVVSVFLMRVLAVPAGWLARRGWRPAPAAATAVVGFLVFLGLSAALIAPPTAREFSTLGDTLSDATEQVEDWLVEDSSFDINRKDVKDFKDKAADRAKLTVEESTDTIAQGARLLVEAVVGFVLALILTFFFLKDGPQFYEWLTGLVPARHRGASATLIRSGWVTLGGYLRGAALLGLLEAVIIGGAMWLVGARLIVPVMLLTFLAAFVPLVGATVAGVLAVLVTLASSGFGDAVVVAAVALLVQQFDNELLAPWIYGKALELHPAIILLSIGAGTALFGIAGTLLAVPVVGIVINGVSAVQAQRRNAAEATEAGDPPELDPAPEGA